MTAESNKNSKATRRIDQAAPSAPSGGYRVCSVSKSGRVNWAYSELLTIEQAQSIAASSRLQVVPAESCPAATRLLPLPPRSAKRLAKMRATTKPNQTQRPQAEAYQVAQKMAENTFKTKDELFDANLNNAMWTLEQLAKSCGVDLEFSGADQTRTPVLNASVIGIEGESFQFSGDTDKGLIEGARKLVAGMIGKLKQFDTMLSERQPAPLPAGLWTIRDAKGEHIAASLYPLATTPKGCQQKFEPAKPAIPA